MKGTCNRCTLAIVLAHAAGLALTDRQSGTTDGWREVVAYLTEAVIEFDNGWIFYPLGSAELALRELQRLAKDGRDPLLSGLAEDFASDLARALAGLISDYEADLLP